MLGDESTIWALERLHTVCLEIWEQLNLEALVADDTCWWANPLIGQSVVSLVSLILMRFPKTFSSCHWPLTWESARELILFHLCFTFFCRYSNFSVCPYAEVSIFHHQISNWLVQLIRANCDHVHVLQCKFMLDWGHSTLREFVQRAFCFFVCRLSFVRYMHI